MATSQNGYKANDDSLVATYTVPGSNVKITLRKGDVSVVLLHFAAWFHKNIQPLRQKDTGGYAKRTIRGSSTTLSNHASATAMDLRWNDHPLGKDNTFSDADEKKIQDQLKYYNGVIRWGGNYSGRKDEMHFEINKVPSAVTEVAKKIKGYVKPKPKPAKPEPLKVDGDLGPKTIKRWQQVMKTQQTGKLSSAFIKLVQRRLNEFTIGRDLVVDGKGIAQDGKKYKTVEMLQRYLKSSPIDGIMSKGDSQVVRALQRRLNEGRF